MSDERFGIDQEGSTASTADQRESPVRGTSDQRIAEIRARLVGVTEGPWFVWDGHEYVGGGRDLCIGAGPTWLANMDHRSCVRREEHMQAAMSECAVDPDADVCSLASDFTAEQEATANFIARAREDVPFLLSVIALLDKQIEELMDENFRLRHGDDDGAPNPESRSTPNETPPIAAVRPPARGTP